MSKEEEREETIVALNRLRKLGLSYELIAVRMGEFLGGINPSVTSLKRWKSGKNAPSALNQMALRKVVKQEKEKENE
jgi:transcriptional regulator with XRE-family HTH domain|tara:strand:- start:1070 stop:1300 length:231 start_codon:yes stop_codon:yes gene_type:complete